MNIEINKDRLTEVMGLTLESGAHDEQEHAMCVMEAVFYVAGEPWTDSPQCSSPVISAFLRAWNDSLPMDKRNEFLRPLIAKLVGTQSSSEVEEQRSIMAADWLVRVHTPAWLRLAGLTTQADVLAGLPQITGMAQVPSLRPVIEAVRKDAAAARDAAGAKLAPTVAELQVSALDLVERMIAVGKE